MHYPRTCPLENRSAMSASQVGSRHVQRAASTISLQPRAMDERLISTRFPRSAAYNPDWVLAAVSGAANAVWMAEWLAEALELRPGMRVLDLGCGRAASSVFLHREFGVHVCFIFNGTATTE